MPERTVVARFDRVQTQPYAVEQHEEPGYKPKGLWYEVDGDWRRWCAGEMPDWVDDHDLHRLTLGDEKILKITTARQLVAFTREWGRKYPSFVPRYKDEEFLLKGIDWRGLAEQFDGIEIAPYQWSQRLAVGMSWYYGWDCASGVIWRPKDARLDLIGRVKVEPDGEEEWSRRATVSLI